MKVLIGLSAMLLPVLCCSQQGSAHAIRKRSAIPATAVTHILNYTDSTFSIASLQNKIVLFDFFTTGCLACIRELPRIDSLQQVFAGSLQVFLVTPESQEQAAAFLKRKNIAALHLPVIYADTLLSRLFPHTYIPHEVLVQHDTVKAITSPEYITYENLRLLSNGYAVHFPYKHDEAGFDYAAPLITLNEEVIPSLSTPAGAYYSLFTTYMDEVPMRYTTTIDTAADAIRITMINVPAVEIYRRMWFDASLANAFIELPAEDSASLTYYRGARYSQEWMQQHLICYQGAFPTGTGAKDIQQKIAADLDFYLHLHSSREERTLPCYVLVKDSSVPASFHKSKAVSKDKVTGVAISDIIFYLNNKYGSTPAINETADSSLHIQGITKENVNNIAFLNRRLRQYGLRLLPAERTLPLLVLSGTHSTPLFTRKY